MAGNPPCVRDIVAEWLRERGYDGLYSPHCACTLDDLCWCDACEPTGCVVARFVRVTAEQAEDLDLDAGDLALAPA